MGADVDRKTSSSHVPSVSRFGEVEGVRGPARSTEQAGWKGVFVDLFKLDDPPRIGAFAFSDVFVGHLHEGTALVEVGGPSKTHLFRPGGLAIFPGGLRLAGDLRNFVCTMTYLQPRILAPEEFERAGRTEIIPQTDPSDMQLRRLMMCLHDELEAGLPSGPLFGESIGTAMLVHILRNYAANSAAPREVAGGLAAWQLQRAKEMMSSFARDEVSLTALAREVDLSPWYFCRAFRQSTGLAPHRWMREARIARAKEMLKRPGSKITDIALELGFYSPSHFSTAFKNATGVTPREYRRRV